MRSFLLLVAFHFIFFFQLSAQDSMRQHFVYFAFDEYELSIEEREKLEVVFASYLDRLSRMELIGHTDSTGSFEYNLNLSKNRVNTVVEYFIQKGIPPEKIFSNFLGENLPLDKNATEQGRQRNRRVEVLFYFSKKNLPLTKLPTPNVNDSTNFAATDDQSNQKEFQIDSIPIKTTNPFAGDTVLVVDGVQIVITKVDYKKYKDCLTIDVIENGEEAVNTGVTTMTVNNDLLTSCGMIRVGFSGDCAGCFEKPIKVRFPVTKRTASNSSCDVCRQRTVFDISDDGRWREKLGAKIRRIRVNGKPFYETMMDCPGSMNCDCKQEPEEIVFKLPFGYRIEKLNVIYDCPVGNYRFLPKRNRAKGTLPCILSDRETFVYLTAIHRQDTFQLERIPLNAFKHSIWKKCKVSRKKNKFLIFKSWAYKTYAKYKLPRKYLKQKRREQALIGMVE